MNKEALWMLHASETESNNKVFAPAGRWSILSPRLAWHPSQCLQSQPHRAAREDWVLLTHIMHVLPHPWALASNEIQVRFRRQFFLRTNFYTVCTQLHLTRPPSSVWSWSQTSPLSLHHSWECTTYLWKNHTTETPFWHVATQPSHCLPTTENNKNINNNNININNNNKS